MREEPSQKICQGCIYLGFDWGEFITRCRHPHYSCENEYIKNIDECMFDKHCYNCAKSDTDMVEHGVVFCTSSHRADKRYEPLYYDDRESEEIAEKCMFWQFDPEKQG